MKKLMIIKLAVLGLLSFGVMTTFSSEAEARRIVENPHQRDPETGLPVVYAEPRGPSSYIGAGGPRDYKGNCVNMWGTCRMN